MKTAIYMRVSTDDQKLDAQSQAISMFLTFKDIKGAMNYVDHGFSGKDDYRPAFNMLLNDIKLGKVERLIVWKLDRLSRKLKTLLELVEQFAESGVKIISTHENFDMTTIHGTAMFQMIGVFAQLERGMCSDRTKAGIAAARAKGKQIGRKPSITKDIKVMVQNLRDMGMSYRTVAKKSGISVSKVFEICKGERK